MVSCWLATSMVTRRGWIRIGDWFVFGAAIITEEDHLQEVRACFLQQGLAAKQSSCQIFVFMTSTLASIVHDASNGRLRTPRLLCQPCARLQDIVTALESELTGDAARSTEGAIIVGMQNQRFADVFKYKTGHTDESASAEKLSQLLTAGEGDDGELQRLVRALHAVATAHTMAGVSTSTNKQRGDRKENKVNRGGKQANQPDHRFQAAFNSALTKLDAVTVWSASKILLDQAIVYITTQVKTDLITDSSTDKEIAALEVQVKKAVGQLIAASRRDAIMAAAIVTSDA